MKYIRPFHLLNFLPHMEAVSQFLTRQELADYAEKHGFSHQLIIPADGEEIVY
ncbi:hypothetical protein K1J10_09815 [Streptococcus australis]|uniref:hypothetical protein n=1 Tax=Streptococcus australis TaxID=113107 RepID=UPI001CC076E7|nr:hypothetical protein [Streptococcus australis]MBZ2154925.1 hypothetical protein [Streptococcus australis]